MSMSLHVSNAIRTKLKCCSSKNKGENGHAWPSWQLLSPIPCFLAPPLPLPLCQPCWSLSMAGLFRGLPHPSCSKGCQKKGWRTLASSYCPSLILWPSKAVKEKDTVTYKEVPIRLSADFSKKTLQARRGCKEVFQVMKGKDLQPRLLYPAKLSFRMEGQIKCSPE